MEGAAGWKMILPYLQTYPSPHNSQPMKLRIQGNSAEIFYDLDLGLPAESFGIPFGHVCAGVFLEILKVAAAGYGFVVDEHLDFRDMDFASKNRLHSLGTVKLVHSGHPPHDLDAQLIKRRRTSRLPYEQRLVPPGVVEKLAAEAQRWGYGLNTTTDEELVKEVIYVNQRTLFYDLSNPAVRAEIGHWLRYDQHQAETTGDGLSAKCLDLPGPLVKLFMGNYWIWNIPLVSPVIKRVYLNSMRGVTQVGWLTGPFKKPEDYVRAGRLFIRLWLMLTAEGVYLHPFGSVITNQRAHKEFCDLVDEDEHGGMAWMLFRFGYSPMPPRAFRRPVGRMLVK
jgi:hypothetical protein